MVAVVAVAGAAFGGWRFDGSVSFASADVAVTLALGASLSARCGRPARGRPTVR